jgi:myotubularin-related protein 5/13
MSRFVDYFVICGFDHTQGRPESPKESSSQVIQRFPEKDWPDVPFIQGIDLFCQPNGWKLSTQRQEPTFFMSVLTAVEGNRLYCPCLSFSEVENSGSGMDYSVMFAPKCLVLLSRHDMVESFRSCLKLIYTVYTEGMNGGVDGPIKLETLVGPGAVLLSATKA